MALTEAQAATSGARHADNELLRLTRQHGPTRHARRAGPPIAFGQT